MEERPAAEAIIPTVQQFLSSCPRSPPLCDLLPPWSAQADLRAELSLSLSQTPTEGSSTFTPLHSLHPATSTSVKSIMFTSHSQVKAEERKQEEEAWLEKAEKEGEEKERAEREAEERWQQEALRREEARLEAEEAQDVVEFPSEEIPRRRRSLFDINAAKRDMSAPLSVLATARNIERLQDIEYPEGVRGPREDLNKDAKDGKFRYLNIARALSICSPSCRYDRDFLIQFMHLCKEKPTNLPPLDILGIEPVDQSTFSMTRSGSGRHRHLASAITLTARQSSVGLGISSGSSPRPGAMPSPFGMGHLEIPRRSPGPLDINSAKRDMSAPPLSVLATARNIERLQDIEYPEGVRSPREDLNKDAKGGKFRYLNIVRALSICSPPCRYDRDFLMQFMQFCKEKPPNLPPLDILGIYQSTFNMTRDSGPHRQPASALTPTARQGSVGLGISSGFVPKPGLVPSPFAMGQFATQTSKLTSEERFLLSTGARSASVSGGPASLQFVRPATMTRTTSQGGPGGQAMGRKRTRTKRGDRGRGANRDAQFQQGSLEGSGFSAPGAVPILGAALEPVAPLEMSANRWVAWSTVRKPGAIDTESPELVDRKVRSLLNKLTMEKFDSISDQIIAWVNKSENEKDGRTLIQVIRLVFEKATVEVARSEMYARLCRKMMETISFEVGGQLFRKHLLNRYQEDFERGWFAKEAAAAKASDDQAIKAANENKGDESELYSDEYYAAQKAKCQRLGFIKFIGELFKLQMITKRIMHECVKKLLGNVANPEEENIESLCQLLKTVGQLLDVPKARAHVDVYFTRMKELRKSLNVSPRMQFMLQVMAEFRVLLALFLICFLTIGCDRAP